MSKRDKLEKRNQAIVPTAKAEPIKMSGPRDREMRARDLAAAFNDACVKFIDAYKPDIVQVRKDFLEKGKNETICGVKTFSEYCERVLRYSYSHIRRLIAGQNPATSKHDGSKNRIVNAPRVERVTTETAAPAVRVEVVHSERTIGAVAYVQREPEPWHRQSGSQAETPERSQEASNGTFDLASMLSSDLRMWERRGLLEEDPAALLESMTDEEAADVTRLAPATIRLLSALLPLIPQ